MQLPWTMWLVYKSWLVQTYAGHSILNQLKFPYTLQGQLHVEHITVAQTGDDQGMGDCEEEMLVQELA